MQSTVPQHFIDFAKQQEATRKVQYELHMVTPLFMHGNKFAELRESSFKGVLRYWWRALQFDGIPAKELVKKEGELFGLALDSKSSKKSPVSLSLPVKLREKQPTFAIRPHDSKSKNDVIGLSNQTFPLQLRVFEKDERFFEQAKAYVEFTFLLGSFGQRSRRGAGALQEKGHEFATVAQFVEAVAAVFKRLQKQSFYNIAKSKHHALQLKDTNRSKFHPVLRNVWIGKPFASGEAVRQAISNAGHLHNSQNKEQFLGRLPNKNKGLSRQASPLIATVRKIGERYYPIISEVAPQNIVVNVQYMEARNKFLHGLGVEL